ncbi:hypothetical protein Ancab_000506 [Ancistrocladus abbreviatus]
MNRELSTSATTICNHCNSDDRWLLHNVRLRGLYRKLCTSCVLKLHPSSFCPTCFALHEPSSHPTPSLHNSNNNRTLVCFKCSSLSHATCVPPNAPKSPYLCPPCSNPNFKFFDFKKPNSSKTHKEGENLKNDLHQSMDQKSAKVLFAAAKIAANSMSKAAASAKGEAERRVREAALARKRAKEALEHVALIAAREREKVKRKDGLGDVGTEILMQKRENLGGREISVLGAVNNNGNTFVGRETGFKMQNAVVPVEKNGGIIAGGVKGGERTVSSSPPGMRQLVGRNLGSNNVNEKLGTKTGYVGQAGKNNLGGEKMSNGMQSNAQHLQNNNGGKEDKGPQ